MNIVAEFCDNTITILEHDKTMTKDALNKSLENEDYNELINTNTIQYNTIQYIYIYIYIYLSNSSLHNYKASYRGIPKSHQGNLMIVGTRTK